MLCTFISSNFSYILCKHFSYQLRSKMEAEAGPSSANLKTKPMLDQVCEAIKTLGKPRIGASVKAIKKHILDSYEESKHGRIDTQIKKAISKGEESGVLVRPAKCKNSVGATGSFLINKEKIKDEIEKPRKNPEDETKNMKKLHKPEDKVVKKPIKPKPKAKNPKKEEEGKDSDTDSFKHSTPKKPDSVIKEKSVKPRALKKTVKGTKNNTFTMKKHASDSELTDVKQKTVKRKNLKEKPKTTTKNNKPGTSESLKETEKEPQATNEKKKPRRLLKSYNSDSVLT